MIAQGASPAGPELAPAPPTQRAGAGDGDGFRPDIEGVRAVAIILVLLYHAAVPGFSGGFVGVDVFFVVSGFLITGLIVRELRRTGTVSLPNFYARRARRLLPAAALALLVTMAASAVMLPPLRVPDVAGDAAAAALYVSNIRFALQATDYLQAELAPSPLLHFWSLGVEEQFYLFWPALLLLVATFRRGGVRNLGPAIAVVAVLSLGLSIWLTGVSGPWAFFSLPTRAWELGLGALIAVSAARLAAIPARLAAVAGWVGLAMVVASAFVIDSSTPFPGTAAILPVAGTALVVVAGLRWPATMPSRLLAVPPMRFFGRISYSLYLWHWPMIVLPAAALDAELPLAVRVALAALTIPVAAASQRWVEDPIRHGRFVGLQTRRTLAMAGALTVSVAVISLGIGRWAGPAVPTVAAGEVSDLVSEPVGSALPDDPGLLPGDPLPTPAPAASGSPAGPSATPSASQPPGVTPAATPAAAPAATPEPSPTATEPAFGGPLPANLLPPLARAKDDKAVIYVDGCHVDIPGTALPECVYGDPRGKTTVALFGDSHAAQWFPALDRLARARGWRLLSLTKSACASADATVYNSSLKRAYTECDTWREKAFTRIERERPDLVIVANARGHVFWLDGKAVPSAEREDLWAAALSRTLERLGRSAGAVAVIGDTPRAATDPPVCLSRHTDETLDCATSRAEAVAHERLDMEHRVAEGVGATFVDPTPWLCSADTCPVVIGRYLVLRDQHHLATPFAAALARRLEVALPAPGG